MSLDGLSRFKLSAGQVEAQHCVAKRGSKLKIFNGVALF